MKSKLIVAMAFLLLAAIVLSGQSLIKGRLALKIREPLAIDGLLSEPDWQKAPEANGFLAAALIEEGASPEATSVKILYDENFLYIGFLCSDSQHEKMNASETGKDTDIRGDESVYVLIDPLSGKKMLYLFGVNLLGTPLDAAVSQDGGEIDVKWEGNWQSASRRSGSGWSAELAIDLRPLGYDPESDKTMAVSFSRVVPRISTSFWRGPLEPMFERTALDQMRTLSLVRSEGATEAKIHFIPKAGDGEIADFGGGLDARLAFPDGGGAQLAIHPDFTTVEPDAELLNMTRFELFYPEKRDFFLEGSEFFEQPLRLFYSKRIGDIWAGAKAYGKIGAFEVIGLSAQEKKDEYQGETTSNFSVLRARRSLSESSSVGFLAANKLVSGRNSGTAGFDASLKLTSSLRLEGQLAVSYGNTVRDALLFFLRPSYDTSTFHFHFGCAYLGKNLGDNVNAVGFIKDDNRQELDAGLEKAFVLKSGQVRQVRYLSRYNIYWGTEGTLRSWEIDQGVALDLTSKFSLSAHHFREYKLYEKKFRNYHTRLAVDFNPLERWQAVSLTVFFGRNFDYPFDMIQIGKRIKVTKNFQFEYDVARLKYRFSYRYGTEGRNGWTHGLRITSQYSGDTSVILYFQYQSKDFHAMTYSRSLNRTHFQIFLAKYISLLRGTLQIGYQSENLEFGQPGPGGNAFYLKYITQFR